MTGFAIRCPGCDLAFFVRLGVSPTKLTKFFVPCPDCGLPIRGRSFGEEIESHTVEFEADRVANGEVRDQELFFTVDPHVPSKYGATERGELGTFPTMTLLHLVGDEGAEELFSALGRAQHARASVWPDVRRVFEYYLVEDWARFEREGSAFFEDWQTPQSAQDRVIGAHRALFLLCDAMTDDIDISASQFRDRYGRKHVAALRVPEYKKLLVDSVQNNSVRNLERGLFDVIERLMGNAESWEMGILRRVLPSDRKGLLEGLTLFRDEFDIVRDLYQQAFENVCKTLKYVVAAQNAVKRGDPNDFGADVPALVSRNANPTSLRKFDELPNAFKIAYVGEVPGWEGFAGLLNSHTRNAIGHASARHDLRTGMIVSDVEPTGLPYLQIVADVYGVLDALATAMHVLEAVQVAGSNRTFVSIGGI